MTERQHEYIVDALEPPALHGHDSIALAFDQFVDVLKDFFEPLSPPSGAWNFGQALANGLANPRQLRVVEPRETLQREN